VAKLPSPYFAVSKILWESSTTGDGQKWDRSRLALLSTLNPPLEHTWGTCSQVISPRGTDTVVYQLYACVMSRALYERNLNDIISANSLWSLASVYTNNDVLKIRRCPAHGAWPLDPTGGERKNYLPNRVAGCQKRLNPILLATRFCSPSPLTWRATFKKRSAAPDAEYVANLVNMVVNVQ